MKKIYIIDSVNVAFSVSLILGDCCDADLIIFEHKKNIDDQIDLCGLASKLYSNFKSVKYRNIYVESPYFLAEGLGFLGKIKAYRSFRKRVLVNSGLSERDIYIGPRTSSIMMSLIYSKRTYIDHGYGEYAERASLITNPYSAFLRAAKCNAKRFLGMAGTGIGKKGNIYSLCKMSRDWACHIDYSYVRLSKEMQLFFDACSSFCLGRSVVLFLAAGERHSKNGLPSYRGSFDSVNLELVKRHVSKSELVIIKFHGSLYCGDEPKTDLVKMLDDIGYESVILDKIAPSGLAGNIPAEAIIKGLNIVKVVSECSATVCNVAHNHKIRSICDFSLSPDFESRNLLHFELLTEVNKYLHKKIEIYK